MIAKTEAELAKGAADAVIGALRQARGERPVQVMLAGGGTPRLTYEELARRREELPIGRLHLFWGDERCVPPDHPESNFRMVREVLLARVSLEDEQIHRIWGEVEAPSAAWEAEKELRAATGVEAPDVPALTIVLLGMGEDGHTASLFPHAHQLEESERLFVPARNPSGYPRVTATLGLIREAERVVFLTAGAKKAKAVRRALEEEPTSEIPASLVRPASGKLEWFIDEAAASELSAPARARV